LPALSESMMIPVPLEGNEKATSITSYSNGTYHGATEESIVTDVFHNIHYATFFSHCFDIQQFEITKTPVTSTRKNYKIIF